MSFKKNFTLLMSLFAGVTVAYFIWLLWKKVTEIIGDSNWVFIIIGLVVALLILTGFVSAKKLYKRFMM